MQDPVLNFSGMFKTMSFYGESFVVILTLDWEATGAKKPKTYFPIQTWMLLAPKIKRKLEKIKLSNPKK